MGDKNHLAKIILQIGFHGFALILILQLLDDLLEKLILELLALHFALRLQFDQTPEIRHEFRDRFVDYIDYPVRDLEDLVLAVTHGRAQPFLARWQVLLN